MSDLMCARRRVRYTLAEIVVVVVILGLLGAVLVPQFSRAGVATQEDQLSEQLRTVRAAVELYRAQHHDAVPDLSKDWTPLTSRTDAEGKIVSATGEQQQGGGVAFGPYLPTPPVNAMTGGSRVSESPDRGVDWWWDSSTGTVSALDGNGISIVVQSQQQESRSSSQ
jgi:type II secretory pathway pseudopilin PulG